jgi:hypothetical protein
VKSEIRNTKSEGTIVPKFARATKAPGLPHSSLFRVSGFGFRVLTLLAVFAAVHSARACAVCFGNSDDKMTQGMLAGVLVLLLVVVAVLGGFVALFIYFARRAAAVAASENQSTESKA